MRRAEATPTWDASMTDAATGGAICARARVFPQAHGSTISSLAAAGRPEVTAKAHVLTHLVPLSPDPSDPKSSGGRG